MAQTKVLRLTAKELDLLRGILGFVDAGEVDGGPLDDESAKQRSANARVFLSLCNKAARA